MSVQYLLDTNICIYIQRRNPPEVLNQFKKLKPGEAMISVITWGELLYGAEKSVYRLDALHTLKEFAALIPVAQMTEDVGRAYGTIRAELESRGQPIGNNDLWIAAHAKAYNLSLVTNNEREFRRISGLNVLNWVAGK